MSNVVYGHGFLKALAVLPKAVQERTALSLEWLSVDAFDVRLHTKTLKGELTGCYSFRVGREYRVLFQFVDSGTIQVFDAGHRRDIYR